MEFKKNVVLTSPSGSQKGVLSYIKNGNIYNFEFKGINFSCKDRILGVYIDNKLYKYNLSGKTLEFKLELDKNVENVSVVVLDKQNMLTPFLWGTQLLTENDFIMSKIIEEINIKTMNEVIEDDNETKKEENISNFSLVENLQTQSQSQKNQVQVETYENNEIEKEQEEIEQDNLLNENQPNIKENEQGEFYSKIASQVEKMLNENQTESILEEIIPDSKFVKVSKGNGDTYIFGVIYENGIVKYLCYGERGKFSQERPEHLREYYQWLPIDVDNVNGDGYFMMYQDAQTGKNLEMTII